jgi:hypothetical protein
MILIALISGGKKSKLRFFSDFRRRNGGLIKLENLKKKKIYFNTWARRKSLKTTQRTTIKKQANSFLWKKMCIIAELHFYSKIFQKKSQNEAPLFHRNFYSMIFLFIQTKRGNHKTEFKNVQLLFGGKTLKTYLVLQLN